MMSTDREISFTIGGRRFTPDNLMVCIPQRYADKFDGREFEDMHEFSMALMFASSANESAFYGDPHGTLRRYEKDLDNALG